MELRLPRSANRRALTLYETTSASLLPLTCSGGSTIPPVRRFCSMSGRRKSLPGLDRRLQSCAGRSVAAGHRSMGRRAAVRGSCWPTRTGSARRWSRPGCASSATRPLLVTDDAATRQAFAAADVPTRRKPSFDAGSIRMREASPHQSLSALLWGGTGVGIDLRSSAAYRAGHIPGSVWSIRPPGRCRGEGSEPAGCSDRR